MIKATIVGCIDYRIKKMMAETIRKYNLNYGDYDLISIILVVHEDFGYKSVKEDL